MSQANKYISWILLAVFGYILTPAALIHEFNGHEDTRCNPGTSAAVETQHVHCKYLQIEAQVYTSPEPVALSSIPGINSLFRIPQLVTPCCAAVLFADLRAPPTV
jgi:hypothetical protein